MAEVGKEPDLIRLIALLLALSGVQAQQYIVSTVAGGVPPSTPVAALQASIELPNAGALDAAGNLYFTSVNCVFKLDAKGVLTRVAGTSQPGYSGDNRSAVSAQLSTPSGLAFDSSGNLYIADGGNSRVRRVSPSGILTTVAGNGTSGFSGDGGPAIGAELGVPIGLALDAAGDLYIADALGGSVRKVSAAGTITAFAGSSSRPPGFSGDGGPAASALLNGPRGVAVDAAGNVYIADTNNNRIRKVSTAGIISTVAGPGTAPQLLAPLSVAVDGNGDLYFASNSNNVGKVSSAGAISTVAGIAASLLGFSGDGGPASSAQLCGPSGVAADSGGNLYFADSCNNRIRKVSSAGIIGTVAGNGTAGYSGDGGPAAMAQLSIDTIIATDAAGNLYISDYPNSRVRMVNAAGVITTIAGTGSVGYSGDGGPAISAQLSYPSALAIDPIGNLYISDIGVQYSSNSFQNLSRIRKVSPAGTITTIAGAGPAGETGDGGPATSAQINVGPLAADTNGNLYFADNLSSHIREISATGVITTIVGAGNSTADGVLALNADVSNVRAMATDAFGDLFIAAGDGRVRKISSSTGIITTVAGKLDAYGFSGDGGPAISSVLYLPSGMAFDGSGNLYIADFGDNRIRRVTADGIITTIAGTGSPGYSGDGGLALNAQISPDTLALGANGRIYFTDANAVRVLTPTGCDYSSSITSLQPPVAGGSFPVTISTGVGCAWTIAGIPDWITSGSLTFSGAATVDLTIAANSGAPRSADLSVAGVEVLVNQPSDLLLISSGGVVNSASYNPYGSAPGSIVSVFGNFLLTNPLSVSGFPIPTNLGGLSLQFGNAPLAPLFYASSGQVNAQIPWELTGSLQTTITTANNGKTSTGSTVSLAYYAPGLYSTNGQGAGQGAILDSNYRLVDSANPAVAGTTVVQIFCTGLGPVTNQPATGAPSPAAPLAKTVTLPMVTIGGIQAPVQFSGLTPGLVGLYQVNALVPAETAGMGTAPVVISLGGAQSNTVTIAVQ